MAARKPAARTRAARKPAKGPAKPASRARTTTRPFEPGPWAEGLAGADKMTVTETTGDRVRKKQIRLDPTGAGHPPPDGDMWRLQMALPRDLAGLAANGIDPLLVASSLKGTVDELEGKIVELVRLARAHGHTWTRIGEALGTSKQAAWERYSGED